MDDNPRWVSLRTAIRNTGVLSTQYSGTHGKDKGVTVTPHRGPKIELSYIRPFVRSSSRHDT